MYMGFQFKASSTEEAVTPPETAAQNTTPAIGTESKPAMGGFSAAPKVETESKPTDTKNLSDNKVRYTGAIKNSSDTSEESKPVSQGSINMKLGVIFLCCIFGSVFFYASWYFDQYQEKSVPYESMQYVTMYEEYEKQINDIIPLYNFDYYNNLQKVGPEATSTIQQIVDAKDINYVHKKRILNELFASIISETVSLDNQINNKKSEIGQYGFFSKDLHELLELDDNKVSLQRSLLSLETIKFSTALKVFGLLDTFIGQFSRIYNIPQDELLTYMKFFNKRSEIDITNYLKSCYMNPFEDAKKCDVIGDFDNYFTFYEPDSKVDTTLFKSLFGFIDDKLSESNFPSLAITFDRFNPDAQTLSFKITVNTLQEDELALINKGILNPHIFVLTNIINQLKESKFIIGEQIIVDNMKINKQEIEVGGIPIVVHNSVRSFSIPLQKSVEREIFDFIPPKREEIRELEQEIADFTDKKEPSFLGESLDVDLEFFGTANESKSGSGSTNTGENLQEEKGIGVTTNITPEAATGSTTTATGSTVATGATPPPQNQEQPVDEITIGEQDSTQ